MPEPTNRAARIATVLVIALTGLASKSMAQVCIGAPGNGGIAYQNGKETFTNEHGATLDFAPGKMGIQLEGRTIDGGDNETGYEGSFRLTMALGQRFKICPTFGAGFDRRVWDLDASSNITTNQIVARGGLGFGYEIALGKSGGIAPFFMAEYVQRVSHFDVKVANSDQVNSGVTGGAAEATIGFITHYSHVFGGLAVSRPFMKAPPTQRRLFIGFAF